MRSTENIEKIKRFTRVVSKEDTPHFSATTQSQGGGNVHPVYSTYAIARDAEWVCRLFVLDLKEANEEGIGTFVNVDHISPALIGQEVNYSATIDTIKRQAIECSFEARVGNKLIAKGRTGQMILPKETITKIFKQAE